MLNLGKTPVGRLIIALSCVGTCMISSVTGPVIADARGKVLYFTFDDGPAQVYTPLILNVLGREKVHATFFVLGYRCRQMPGMVRRIERGGHEIGSHGYDHRSLTSQPNAVVEREVRMADAVIECATGSKPVYYRPAYGALAPREVPVVRHMGHTVMLWTVDSEDWKARSASTIVRNVERSAGPGSVVLFHDGISNSRLTAQALPTLIRYYRARGYVFRRLPLHCPAASLT